MASNLLAISFQYFAICCDSSLVALVPGIKIKILGCVSESALAEAGEVSCFEQVPKTIERARQIGVMTEARTEASRQARLVWIDLPGMDVNHRGHTFPLGTLQADSRIQLGQQAKIAAATDGQVVSGHAKGGDGKLGHRAGRRLKTERSARRIWHSVEIVVNGEDTGVVGKA